ncbi:LrgB family protein, partial [Pseudomonas aeruginosa]|nr:LrgB family protein [Pseudomonas aeruginosa]
VLRPIIIFAGSWLISQFDWLLYVFGAFLLFTGVKMALAKEDDSGIGDKPLVRWIRSHLRMTDKIESERFFTRKNGVLFATPLLLVLILVVGHISYQSYMGETHWLLWLLGPATIAFAVPVYENVAVIKRHWMLLSAGVVTAVVVAVTSSVWLARGFMLSDEIQRSLAVRSVTTPFALAAAKPLGGQPDLVALF